ncbi:hypothetical protein ANCCAN_15181 [Ancylostoma caninum]|uniref:Uncharacterized protein n=1 Tax=Ancylostoma caninum TaxID=29170 RepID=A0A368G6I9_ANCCA|nr:hypothetical protein ANCCAN_15181 [Ancylostoma caninum]
MCGFPSLLLHQGQSPYPGHPVLFLPLDVKMRRTPLYWTCPRTFWLKLGNNDVVRKAALPKRKEYRADWAVAGRQLMGRAL